jgi:hypothetical protein
MTMTTARRRRLQVSYALHLQQQTAAVSDVVANVTAAIVDLSVCQWRLRQRTTRTTPEHVRSRRQLRQRRRRSVRDIYKELGAAIYFRRAYRMTYQSFKHLAALLCPYILAACGKKGNPRNY